RAERDASEKLFKSSLVQAQANRWSGRLGQRFQGLEALREAASLVRSLDLDRKDLLEVRNGATACLALADLRVARQWPAEDPPNVPTEAVVWDLPNGQTIKKSAGPEEFAVLGFSPDSRCFVTSRIDGSVCLHDLFTAKERRFTAGVRADHIAFRPDGRQLAF